MSSKKSVSRRMFIKTTAAAASICALPFVSAQSLSANDKIRLAVIGLGGRGLSLAHTFAEMPNVEIAAVVDPDSIRVERAATQIKEKHDTDVLKFKDARLAMDDKNVDAVVVATCNHWHSLMAVWGCQAGKHVYVEKPLSHTLMEGRRCIEAASRAKVCVQHGTQNRSNADWARAGAAFRAGKYGTPLAVHAFAHRPRPSLGFKPAVDPPEYLDWDLWLGPVEMVPYHGNLVPYNWHWFWNTGNGEIGNNGVHYFDLCRWALGDPMAHPTNVVSFGTRFVNDKANGYKDQAETPNMQAAVFDFNGIPCIFEACALRSKNWTPYETAWLHTSDGHFEGPKTFVSKSGERVKVEFDGEVKLPQEGGHQVNFIECMRNNTPDKLNAPVEAGHYSASVCHLANISYRLGETSTWDKCCAAVESAPILPERLEVIRRNMEDVLTGIDLQKDVSFTLGKKVSISSATETFDGEPEANALAATPGRGDYRY
ncbi:MAG: Gfo/Idh/MocA family oxidoreductase [Planctomycetia bacterium]|nr:Gfo/Idh/MocA family oxidoreductase [Planctomycetia bacterium]